jgi:hypothetical protein
LIRQQFPLVVNQAFVLFLTISAIPAITVVGDYPGMLAGLLLGAGYAGLLLAMVRGVTSLRAKRNQGVGRKSEAA